MARTVRTGLMENISDRHIEFARMSKLHFSSVKSFSLATIRVPFRAGACMLKSGR
jgi:hypothetical protein